MRNFILATIWYWSEGWRCTGRKSISTFFQMLECYPRFMKFELEKPFVGTAIKAAEHNAIKAVTERDQYEKVKRAMVGNA
jgi:hypothetical protein